MASKDPPDNQAAPQPPPPAPVPVPPPPPPPEVVEAAIVWIERGGSRPDIEKRERSE